METCHTSKKIFINVFSKKEKKGDPNAPYGKLIKDDKNNRLYRVVNVGYTLFMIVMNFSKKILWFGSCFAFMYLFPMSLELFNEQKAILDKIQQSQMMESMGGAGMGAQPVMHSF